MNRYLIKSEIKKGYFGYIAKQKIIKGTTILTEKAISSFPILKDSSDSFIHWSLQILESKKCDILKDLFPRNIKDYVAWTKETGQDVNQTELSEAILGGQKLHPQFYLFPAKLRANAFFKEGFEKALLFDQESFFNHRPKALCNVERLAENDVQIFWAKKDICRGRAHHFLWGWFRVSKLKKFLLLYRGAI